MLIDEVLPTFDETEVHDIEIGASAARVYQAVRAMDLSTSVLVRALLALRGLPSLLAGERRPSGSLGLDELQAAGFTVVRERTDVELVLGLVGRPWTAVAQIRRLRANEFEAFDEAGYAKMAWNFSLEPLPGGRTRLRTETRILCTDDAGRRRFRRYWFFIRPFSGLIRMQMLRGIRDVAEAAAGPAASRGPNM